MIQIRTDRGKVKVIDADCARRPCLHIHWSRHYTASRIDKRTGADVRTYPLVCIRNEDHGCPHPLPEPADD
jgi:hypothetical protein